MLKKITLTVLSFFIVFSTVATPAAYATSTWYNQSWNEFYGKVYSDSTPPSEIFGERYTAAQVQWVYYSLVSMVFNLFLSPKIVMSVMTGDLSELTINPEIESTLADVSKPETKSFLTMLTEDRPLSGITYVKDIGRKLNIVKEAHAQQAGFGYSALEMIKGLWNATRNVSYLFFIIAAIVLAFMVMFRFKVGPQTVVTVQSSIPKLALAMVFVTFSYAIAGFLIDMMYVVIGLFAIIYNSAFGMTNHDLSSQSSVYTFMIAGPRNSGLLGASILYAVTFFIGLLASIYGPNGIINGSDSIWTRLAGNLISPAIISLSFILCLIIVLILLWVIIKTTWTMLKTFASVLIKIIMGPIMIALGVVIPGMGFGSWMKGLIADLAVFPFISGALVLAFIFLVQGMDVAFAGHMPAQLVGYLGDLDIVGVTGVNAIASYNYNWPPILGGGSSLMGFLFIIVSLVIMSSISKASDIIKGLITGRPLGYGAAIGDAMAAGAFGYGMGERQVLGRLGEASGNRIIGGSTSTIDRWMTRLASSRGHLNMPSVTRVTRR